MVQYVRLLINNAPRSQSLITHGVADLKFSPKAGATVEPSSTLRFTSVHCPLDSYFLLVPQTELGPRPMGTTRLRLARKGNSTLRHSWVQSQSTASSTPLSGKHAGSGHRQMSHLCTAGLPLTDLATPSRLSQLQDKRNYPWEVKRNNADKRFWRVPGIHRFQQMSALLPLPPLPL